ncbi:MAG TPA: phage tail protein [Candidatus Entotheonella sp.]|jgi:phage tail-like protein
MPRRPNDPFTAFNFQLEIDGITRAGFSECTGLNAEANMIEYREGNESLTTRKLHGLIKYGNVTLKWGVTQDPELFNWFKTVVDGDIDRKQTMSVVLLDEQRVEAVRWNIINAWPSKYVIPDMKSDGNEIAFESVELCHEGVERQ